MSDEYGPAIRDPEGGGRARGMHAWVAAVRATVTVVGMGLLCLLVASPAAAQEVQGRIVDASSGVPVRLAGVFLLDGDHRPVRGSSADTAGFYTIEAPEAGEYTLFVQRLGYFENETPLLALDEDGSYGVDIEMRPEPFRLDPIDVTVRNEELEHFLTLKLGVNPNSVFGYRAVQGLRLAEAKLKADDNTDLLRWLYIPVSHGQEVCVGRIGMSLPERLRGQKGGDRQCGALYLDDHRWRNEHIEEIDMDRIAVVVVLEGAVHLYTRRFDWTMRPGN